MTNDGKPLSRKINLILAHSSSRVSGEQIRIACETSDFKVETFCPIGDKESYLMYFKVETFRPNGDKESHLMYFKVETFCPIGDKESYLMYLRVETFCPIR